MAQLPIINDVRRAFTLVELLIVIIVIAVIAAIAIPKFANSTERSKASTLRAQLKLTRGAVDRFVADIGYYPLNLHDLTVSREDFKAAGSIACLPNGTTITVDFNLYQGPYLDTAGMIGAQAYCLNRTTTGDKVEVPKDPITGTQFVYKVIDGIPQVRSGSTATGPDGVPYEKY